MLSIARPSPCGPLGAVVLGNIFRTGPRGGKACQGKTGPRQTDQLLPCRTPRNTTFTHLFPKTLDSKRLSLYLLPLFLCSLCSRHRTSLLFLGWSGTRPCQSLGTGCSLCLEGYLSSIHMAQALTSFSSLFKCHLLNEADPGLGNVSGSM